MEEILKQIGIKKEPEKIENGYLAISINDSDEYAIYYSLLENSDLVDIDDDSSTLTYESSSIQYDGDGFIITLIGDFEADTYKLTIKETN